MLFGSPWFKLFRILKTDIFNFLSLSPTLFLTYFPIMESQSLVGIVRANISSFKFQEEVKAREVSDDIVLYLLDVFSHSSRGYDRDD
jgi:hypothetical protein